MDIQKWIMDILKYTPIFSLDIHKSIFGYP